MHTTSKGTDSLRGISRLLLLLTASLVLAACEIEGEGLDDTQDTGGSTGGGGGAGGGGTPSAVSIQTPAAATSEATGPLTAVTLTTPTVTGGDGNYTIANDAPAAGFPLGTTNVIWTATDGAGASATASQSVSVSDTTAPAIGALTNVQAPSTGTLTPVTLTAPSVTDLVDPSPAMQNDAPANGFPMGMTVVTWTATDASGNSANAEQTVMITAPSSGPLTITAPADVTGEATGPATALTLGMANAGGGQGQLSITNDAPAGGFPVGATLVVWTVTDAANTMVTDSQTVTVTDTTAPTITAPANVSRIESGTLPTTVVLGTPTVSDLADPAPAVTNNAPAAGFPLGTTDVTWTATDASGNQATAVQRVTINPPPTCSSLQPEFAADVYPVFDEAENCGSCHTPPNIVSTTNGFNILANDATGFELFRTISNIDINGESSMTVKALGGATHGGGDRFAGRGGALAPDYVVIEEFVTKVTNCTDTPVPLTLMAPMPVTEEATGANTTVTLGTPQAVGGDGNYTYSNDAPAGGFPLGATTVTWTVTDGTSATATATQTITVSDTTAPTLAAPASVTVPENGTPTPVALGTPTVSDIVDPAPAVTNNAPAGGFPLGTTNVTWTATDASGNEATAVQVVTVNAPAPGPLTVTAPANVAAEATGPTTNVAIGMASAMGGQGMLTITNNAPAGGYPVGATTVVWTVTDTANATATANQTVTINDTTAPSITAPADVTGTQNGASTPVTLGTPTVSDLADPAPAVTNNAPPGGFAVGTTTVTWTATDASGNQGTATQTVTIQAAPTCDSLQPEFATAVYPVLDQPATCASCHTPPNIVATANGFNIAANDQTGYDLFRAIANIQIGGESSMTVKALGGGTHGGGNRFAANGAADPDYVVIADFVAKVESCTETPPTSTATIDLGTGYEQLHKVTMLLGARPPSSSEIQAVEAQATQAGITAMLETTAEQLMTEEAFYQRLMEIYNDVLLTDRDMLSEEEVQRVFDIDGFSTKGYFESYSGDERDALRQATNFGLARAPLELVRYVVENDRPFTEILTADYIMVNPYSATVLGVDAGDPTFPFSSDDVAANHDRNEFRRADALMQDQAAVGPYPLAGVVSTHSWLGRYLSTSTNVNRHRASTVFYDFLGIDIEGLAARDGLDLDNVIGDVPTYQDPQCTVCHDVMDPVAGLFKNRSDAGEYLGNAGWQHTRTTNGVPRMLPPGYSADPADELPAGDYDRALPWLMQRIAADDRFAKETVRTIFNALTGIDSTAPAVTSFLTALKNDFVASGFDMKNLVRDIVTSEYVLATNLDAAADPNSYPDIGTGRLLTPEELARKISNVIGDGYVWNGPNSDSGLAERYELFYGGIDSEDIVTRTKEPNTIIDGIQERIAYQLACERVALELGSGTGNLFPNVGITDAPPAAEAAIRQNMVHLHRLLLGEDYASNAAEIDVTYQLFVDVRATGQTAIASACRGGGGSTDTNGTVIPWMAVVAYLASDFRFFYE